MIFSKKFNIFLVSFLLLGIIMAVTPEQKDKLNPPKDWMENSLVHEVSVVLLAEWLVTAKKDFVVADLRTLKKTFSIPGAVDIKKNEELLDLSREKKIVILADSQDESVKASRFLNYNKYHSYILSGDWSLEVLNPKAPTESNEDLWATYQKRVAVANFLTGKNTDSVPTLVAPTPIGAPVMKKKASSGGGGC